VPQLVPVSAPSILTASLFRDFAQIQPFNNQSDYHFKCQITDFGNATNVEQCRLANLPVRTPPRTATTATPPVAHRISIKTTSSSVPHSYNGLEL